ncbi:MAG TPA: dihydroorotase [Flavobacteriales bacterium]|nr:dihydroorotase [Flavobacteriales bacterium]
MNLLIKQAKVVDPNSPHNGKRVDILIENGQLKSIRKNISSNSKTISGKNLHVSPGWFDMHVNFRDPGDEHKEDLNSGCRAAAFGGFTGVACMPGTNPPLHTKADIEYIISKAKGNVVDVHPIGALSKGLQGKEMTEMYDMSLSGAVAFSDEKNPISSAGVLSRALLYVNMFNGLVISHSQDESIALEGQMNEGDTSTSLGLNGMPALAEEIMITRDVYLAEYTNSRLHFATISTGNSVEIIRNAKRKGIKVTAEVAAHQIGIDDSELVTFDSNFKVNPPLRTKEDIAALKKGLSDGTIDAICSDHNPEDVETKNREFDIASFGVIGLETAYAVANTHSGLTSGEIVDKMSISPRKILGIEVPVIKNREKANLTIFDPKLKWTYRSGDIRSKSANSPFIDKTFTGKSIGIFNNNKYAAAD